MNSRFPLSVASIFGALLLSNCSQSSEEWRYLGAVTPSQIEGGDPRWEGNELVLMGTLEIADNTVWIVDRTTAQRTSVAAVSEETMACLRDHETKYIGIGSRYDEGEIVFIGEIWGYGGEVPTRLCV